jgi:hypothetical protein
MARALDRLPQRRGGRPSIVQRTAGVDRVGWGDGAAAKRASAIARRAALCGFEPNGTAAGTDRAAVMVGDVMRYAAAFGLELTIEQARGILDRCGWLTYTACAWIDRLIVAAARDLAD